MRLIVDPEQCSFRRIAYVWGQVKGLIKDAAGMVQEKAGNVIGSTGQQSRGLAKQAGGKLQKSEASSIFIDT